MEHGVPYGGPTPPWEHSYPTLDTPFIDDMYAKPTQWVYGESEVDYQLGTQIEDEMGPYEPCEESTEALESPHFTLDTPFVDYMYTEPAKWSYQGPPISPQFQPEPMLYHPYSPPLPVQQLILHCPITQPFHPTHHNHPTGPHLPSGPTHRTQPRAQRGLHQSGQQHKSHPQTRRGTYLGSWDGNQARSLR